MYCLRREFVLNDHETIIYLDFCRYEIPPITLFECHKCLCSLYPTVNKYEAYPCGGRRIIPREELPESISTPEELNAAVRGFLFCRVSARTLSFISTISLSLFLSLSSSPIHYYSSQCPPPPFSSFLLAPPPVGLSSFIHFRCLQVLPPRQLDPPVLPAHQGGKLKFGLCRTCNEQQLTEFCTHTDEERTLTGTWATVELELALEEGYRIVQCIEVRSKEEGPINFLVYSRECTMTSGSSMNETRRRER